MIFKKKKALLRRSDGSVSRSSFFLAGEGKYDVSPVEGIDRQLSNPSLSFSFPLSSGGSSLLHCTLPGLLIGDGISASCNVRARKRWTGNKSSESCPPRVLSRECVEQHANVFLKKK